MIRLHRAAVMLVLGPMWAVGCNALLDNGDGVYVPDAGFAGDGSGSPDAAFEGGGSDAPISPFCATGYQLETREAGAACEWRGGPRDPDFQNAPQAWQLGTQAPGSDWGNPYPIGIAGGTGIEPDASTGFGPGQLRVQKPGLCTPNAGQRSGAYQRIDMPNLGETDDPFALVLRANQLGGRVRIGVQIGNATYVRRPSNALASVCLGEHAYGRDKLFWISSFLGSATGQECTDGTALEGSVDYVSIVPNRSCPRPGAVLSGDFENASDWSLEADDGAKVEIASNLGTAGSPAAHMISSKTCQRARIMGYISVPLGGRPALQFTLNATAGRKFEIDLSRFSAGAGGIVRGLVGTGSPQSYKVCLPEYSKGYVSEIKLLMPPDPKPGIGCPATAQDDLRDYLIDDMSIEPDDSSCLNPAYVVDGDFEGQNASPWDISGFRDPAYSTSGGIGSGIEGPTKGTYRQASAITHDTCTTATIRQTITVPAPAGDAGPAVQFFYHTHGTSAGAYRVELQRLDPSPSAWTKSVHCLPPAAAGQPYGLNWYLDHPRPDASACGVEFGPQQELLIDDVSVGTDPSCTRR